MFFLKKSSKSRSKPTDTGLIKDIKQGDSISEKCLLERYLWLVAYGRKRYKLREDASLDCFTDAYLDMLKEIRKDKFSGDQALKPFFLTIFKRKCVDQIRRNTSNKVRGTDSLDELLKMGSSERSALEQLISKDLTNKVRQGLRQLSDNCQALIDLWAYNYSHKEIATILSNVGSASSSKTMLNRCLKKVKDCLGLAG